MDEHNELARGAEIEGGAHLVVTASEIDESKADSSKIEVGQQCLKGGDVERNRGKMKNGEMKVDEDKVGDHWANAFDCS